MPVSAGAFLHAGSKARQEDGVCVLKDLSQFVGKVCEANQFPLGKVDLAVPRTLVAVLDGHGGDACMAFARTRLKLQVVVEFLKTPHDWPAALSRAIIALENKWSHKVLQKCPGSRSGTTITVCVIEDSVLHAAWTGDSPAWLHLASGEAITITNTVHRPDAPLERRRIEQAGGEIKANDVHKPSGLFRFPGRTGKKISIPRVYPSGLNISRSLGDSKYKLAELGGRPGVVIAEPDVLSVPIADARFLVLCTDGVSDFLVKGPAQLNKTLERGFRDAYNAVRDGREEPRENQTKMDLVGDLLAERVVFYAVKKNHTKYQDNATALVVSFLSNLHGVEDLDR